MGIIGQQMPYFSFLINVLPKNASSDKNVFFYKKK